MMKIDLNMSDPLTLGLTIGMGHSTTERIRRLTMRKTNKMMRSGTAMIVLAGLGLSSSIIATAASEPVEQAVKTVLKKVDIQPELQAPETPTAEIQKLADAAEGAPTPATTSVRASDLKPMRLRMHPRFSTEQLEKIQKQREAYVSNKADKNALKALDGTFARGNFLNRFQVTISDDGTGLVEISKGQGGWPGHPITNPAWMDRPLSLQMQKGLKDIMKKCISASGPVYFNAEFTEGDGDIGKGTFEVECVPGSDVNRSQVTDTNLAHAYLASDELPLEQRQDYFQWKIGFAKMKEYVVNNPDATLDDDRKACVRMNTEHIEKHTFNERHRKVYRTFLNKCADPDYNYNWVRIRNNIPEVQ